MILIAKKMGKTQSKNENGDVQLTTIVQNQENHSEDHNTQIIISWLILAAVLMQLIITLYTLYKRRERKVAIKAAKSVAALDMV